MSSLRLDSLEIQQFRAFRHLRVEKLGRVNLIVGKNNIGKSSLLEALWLYARRGQPSVVRDILDLRDETKVPDAGAVESDEPILPVMNLFYGRANISEQIAPLVVSSANDPESKLSLSIRWYVSQTDTDSVTRLHPLQPGEYTSVENPILGVRTQVGSRVSNLRLIRYSSRRVQDPLDLEEIPNIYIRSGGADQRQSSIWWDSITLTELQEEVIKALHLISTQVEAVNFVGGDRPVRERMISTRVPIIKVAGFDRPMPLKSLGEGMNRVFDIVLGLVNSRDGLLLVDEIENGIHYSVQRAMWRLLFELSRRLNVQIFATTHSWDCIEAFQEAAQEDEQSEGMLIRLGLQRGDVVATLFQEQELAIATREQIEVR